MADVKIRAEAERIMKHLTLLTCVTAIGLTLALPTLAVEPSQDIHNPNCSPGLQGCTANYPTSDVTKDSPLQNTQNTNATVPANPNCTHGERDCSANYPTGDITKTKPSPQK